MKITRFHGVLHKTKHIIVNGFSSFVSNMAMGVIAMLFHRQVMRYIGADALAVFGVIVQITGVVQCSSYSIGQAAQPLLSANFGINGQDGIRATKRYAMLTSAVFGVLWTASVLLFPNGYVHLFMSPTDSVL